MGFSQSSFVLKAWFDKAEAICHFSYRALLCQTAHFSSLKMNDFLYGQLTK